MVHYENDANFQALSALAKEEGAAVLPVAAKFEEDIADMDPEEAQMFMEELGLTERGLDRLIRTSYDLLGYISFLTAGEDDVHAWTIVRGTKAPKAAGKVHTDIERGFIRAEIVAFDDLKACGTMNAAKEKGLVRSEGKEYVMQDGDITYFKFNV
jgi:ribosome-binding ATPase YchF (GTP1/OBG family)